jgi:hypothetical protein
MKKFQNIKQICSCFNQLGVIQFVQKLGWTPLNDFDTELNFLKGREIEFEQIIKSRRLSARHGPVKKGAEKNGKWKDLFVYDQVFIKDAPHLKNILNEVSKYFKFKLKGKNNLKVSGYYGKDSPDLIDSVNYVIGAEEVHALDVTGQKMMEIESRQTGNAIKSEGITTLELDVEIPPELVTIIHDLTHLKWPESLPQAKSLVNKVCGKVADELKNAGFSECLNDSEIQKERSEALKAFESLDGDLEKFFMM